MPMRKSKSGRDCLKRVTAELSWTVVSLTLLLLLLCLSFWGWWSFSVPVLLRCVDTHYLSCFVSVLLIERERENVVVCSRNCCSAVTELALGYYGNLDCSLSLFHQQEKHSLPHPTSTFRWLIFILPDNIYSSLLFPLLLCAFSPAFILLFCSSTTTPSRPPLKFIPAQFGGNFSFAHLSSR